VVCGGEARGRVESAAREAQSPHAPWAYSSA